MKAPATRAISSPPLWGARAVRSPPPSRPAASSSAESRRCCGRPDRVLPRIGAARSTDGGATWEDLGIILEAPPGWEACGTSNQYFVGGVGDVSVVLDRDARDLYFFFSQYSRYPEAQGIAVARMLWADRDAPAGRLTVWKEGVWESPAAGRARPDDEGSEVTWSYGPGTPLVRATRPWHDADPVTDAFWGASVHWNRFLDQYVMFVNRTKDERFGQEGIYVAFAPALDNPSLWSAPQRILAGGSWYPQIIGLEIGDGTDKQAGERARFFMAGVSNYYIEFHRAGTR